MLADLKNRSDDRIPAAPAFGPCKVVAIWIDWYAYHLARFQGLLSHQDLEGAVQGIEMVGGVGVHPGLKFKQTIPNSLPVNTLMPEADWQAAGLCRLAVRLWRRLNELQPLVVLVPGYYNLPVLAAALWAKVNRRKSVLLSESTEQDHLRIWWREKVKAILITSLFDWAVVGGQPHRRYMEALGFPNCRIAGCYDVVDNKFFEECCRYLRGTFHPCQLGLPSQYFLYVGRISHEKNVAGLVTSFAAYRKAGGTWNLVIVGDGPEGPAVQKLAQQMNIFDEITFAGLKNASQLPEYYSFASAFVLPSTREPWGLVVNEAMASGLPVIVSRRCGCIEDLVKDGENGYTFDPIETGELTNCLLRMSNTLALTRDKMGRRSSEIVVTYSPEKFAENIARIVNVAL